MRYGDVIVSVASRRIDRPFCYEVAEGKAFDALQIGSLVAVSFGRRTVPGFVVSVGGDPTVEGEIKPVEQVIGGPYFTSISVQVARWMSDYYASPLANCLNLFTPALGRNWRKPTIHRRRDDAQLPAIDTPRHEHLTAGQIAALDAIKRLEAGRTLLLDGVTGSGKTEVYLRAIEDALDGGGCAIVLVPEISLTPQTVGRFRARFGDIVSVLHSRLTPAQRAHQLERIRTGAVGVVVGPRSALYAPLHNLAMIVIDEEHDGSYKQESDPRYHARKVAGKLAELSGAKLILGSATPSFETLALVQEGSIASVRLPDRVLGQALPPVEIVDMTLEFDTGNRSMFSRVLQNYLQRTYEARQKAILLLNRRGFANFVLCRECGYVPMCPSCAVSLTLHRSHGKLQCHHCGHLESLPPVCPQCSSPYLASFGAGTQKVEDELKKLFDDWSVVRMDADTTAGRTGHQDRLAAFEALETGVLVGTQMIAKGLDYPEVTLVGIIAADSTLNIPEYSSVERTYQLLEQVAGRTGRGVAGGQVVVQTYQPHHPAIRFVTTHDRSIVLRSDLSVRRQLGYPPYTSMANVVVSSTDEQKAAQAATFVGQALRSVFDKSAVVLGPVPCAREKLKNRYRHHVLVKGERREVLGPRIMDELKSLAIPPDTRVTVDIDPLSMN